MHEVLFCFVWPIVCHYDLSRDLLLGCDWSRVPTTGGVSKNKLDCKCTLNLRTYLTCPFRSVKRVGLVVQIAGGVMGKEVYLRGQKNSYDHHRWISELNCKYK